MSGNPYLIQGPALISFSGGRTSGYMLKHIQDAHGGTLPDDVHVTFANTGREMPETLDFVQECAERWNVRIVWLELDYSEPHGTRIVSHNSASRNGEPFKALIDKRGFLPNPVARFCTQDMKVRRMKWYMHGMLGYDRWTNVVGLRADEAHRVARLSQPTRDRWTSVAPLAAAGVTKRAVLLVDAQHARRLDVQPCHLSPGPPLEQVADGALGHADAVGDPGEGLVVAASVGVGRKACRHQVVGIDKRKRLLDDGVAMLAEPLLPHDEDDDELFPERVVIGDNSPASVLLGVRLEEQAAAAFRLRVEGLGECRNLVIVLVDRLDWPQRREVQVVGHSVSSEAFFPSSRSRRRNSRSTASRMNSARRFFPATTSIRSAMPSGSRTNVGVTFNFGRPMRDLVTDIGKFVNPASKAISLIDSVTDIAYKDNQEPPSTTETDEMAQIAILGYEPECYCDHCGRALQHGVKVSGLGTVGADCLNKLIKADRKRFSGTGKPGAPFIRTLAKLKERDSDTQLSRMGYRPSSFVFEVAA